METLRNLLAYLKSDAEASESILAAFWVVLGGSWELLGPPSERLGTLLERLGSLLGPFWTLWSGLVAVLRPLGVLLEPPWEHLGVLLEPPVLSWDDTSSLCSSKESG